MRLLVLDGSQVLQALVRRLVPADVEVEVEDRFERAVAALVTEPPDALIVNIGPTELPWRHMKVFCQQHDPKIPVLFESCVFETSEEAGLGPLNHSAFFLSKPYSTEDLRSQIDRLVTCASEFRTPSRIQTG
jgi:DNA-binding response OmpR family regulator